MAKKKLSSIFSLGCGRHSVKFETDGNPQFASGEFGHQKTPEIIQAYEELFDQIRPDLEPHRMLEIGVWHGGSLAMWEEIFCGVEVLGVDYQDLRSPAAHEHLRETGRVSVHLMIVPDSRLGQLGDFDLIVDDGGHGNGVVPPTFEILWPRLRSGGIYVVEDWKADFCQPRDLVGFFLDKIRGYWPGPTAPPGAPHRLHLWRGLFALEKRA